MQIAVYDNGGKTIDRYTVAIVDKQSNGLHDCLSLSANPTHPQGVSMYTSCQLGRHLGKRISFADLPPAIQAHVIYRLG